MLSVFSHCMSNQNGIRVITAIACVLLAQWRKKVDSRQIQVN